jgi:hypothetical protein
MPIDTPTPRRRRVSDATIEAARQLADQHRASQLLNQFQDPAVLSPAAFGLPQRRMWQAATAAARAQLPNVQEQPIQDEPEPIREYRRALSVYVGSMRSWIIAEENRRATSGATFRSRVQLQDYYMRNWDEPTFPNGFHISGRAIRGEFFNNIWEGAPGTPAPTPMPVEPQAEPVLPYKYQRGEATPPFFINYSSVEEFQLRLRGTYILYKGSPVFVQAVSGNNRNPILVLQTNGLLPGFQVRLPEAAEFIDARPVAPGYVNVPSWRKGCGYLCRQPARVQRQGICGDNTALYIPGGSVDPGSSYNLGRFPIEEAIQILGDQSETPYDPKMVDDLRNFYGREGGSPSKRLSRNFAVIFSPVKLAVELGFRNKAVATLDRGSPDLTKLPSSLHEECRRLNLM